MDSRIHSSSNYQSCLAFWSVTANMLFWNLPGMLTIISGSFTQAIYINQTYYKKQDKTSFKICCSHRRLCTLRECDGLISGGRICHSNRRQMAARYTVDVFSLTLNHDTGCIWWASDHDRFGMHTLVVVARLLYVFVYSLSFCTSCAISIINKIGIYCWNETIRPSNCYV